MKRFVSSLSLLSLAGLLYGQGPASRGEFATNRNGLMYSDADLGKLRYVVDSLNLRYKTCELNKTYYSCPQGKVYYISFSSKTDNLQKIIGDIKQNPDFFLLADKYKNLVDEIDTSILVIRGRSNEQKNPFYYLKGNPSEGYDEFYDASRQKVQEKSFNQWIYEYSPIDSYSKTYDLSCHFFPGKLGQQPIPGHYARLIQYVDCMIDTNAVLFLTNNFNGGWFPDENKKAWFNLAELAGYLDKKMGSSGTDNKKLKQLGEAQVNYAVNNLQNDTAFLAILGKTIDEYVKHTTPHHQLETLAEKLKLYDKALLMKRSYRVMGGCSMDTRPREHARDIALLAAQSHSWDIFLRAHLDIMNDRFERASDGSYAWAGRQTYLKELEELNLNIVDLMLGLTLRADNVASNHYYGTIWRMGRALSESREKVRFEEKAIAMLKDESLDEFNRGLVFLLYHTYINYLGHQETLKRINMLRKDKMNFPYSIRAAIDRIKDPKPPKKG